MWLLEPLHVGRGAQPTAPEAGALPETGRYRVTFQKSKSYRLLVLEVICYSLLGKKEEEVAFLRGRDGEGKS
jgi:hypothetical protein